MSEPLRYDPGLEQGITDAEAVMFQCPDGSFVKYADYASLKAEVELWKLRSDNWQKFCQLHIDENARLKAEVERLRIQVGTDAIDREYGMCCDSSADYARLKAEVENSNRINTELLLLSNQQASEVRRLKAEVERLTAQVSYDNRTQLHVDKLAAEFTQCEVEKLKAENKRLRKAGDWMCGLLRFDFVTKEWNAAKEGKSSV